MPDFSVVLEQTHPVVVVAASGEVDAATVAELDAVFNTAVTDHDTHVVVDARGITFIDSTGISALVAGMRRLNRSRRRMAVACETSGPVGRALEVTGLDHTFECHTTTDAAVAALAGAPLIGR